MVVVLELEPEVVVFCTYLVILPIFFCPTLSFFEFRTVEFLLKPWDVQLRNAADGLSRAMIKITGCSHNKH